MRSGLSPTSGQPGTSQPLDPAASGHLHRFLGLARGAGLEPIWSTLVVFLIMLAGLLRALTYAQEERVAIRAWSPLAQVLPPARSACTRAGAAWRSG